MTDKERKLPDKPPNRDFFSKNSHPNIPLEKLNRKNLENNPELAKLKLQQEDIINKIKEA